MEEKYYKVLNADGISPTTNFDYTPYLPSLNKAGTWLPKIDNAKIRKDGYYASKYWTMWYSHGKRVYEVELADKIIPEDCGVEHQVCTSEMRLLKDVTDDVLKKFAEEKIADEANEKILGQKWNLGANNTGLRNIGSNNAGDFNLGSRNTGKRNRGDFNTGDANVGIDNVGDNNCGSANVGSNNIGHSNTGDGNKGSYNSGSANVGHKNSGSFNKGNGNSGKWNIGNFHCGFFNTDDEFISMFNKPTNLKSSEIKLPIWLNKPDCKAAFEAATRAEIEQTLALPNFDYSIFEEITGISKADFDRKLL